MPDSPISSDDVRVEAILAEWFERQFAGGDPDVDELCAETPHLAPRVREMLEREQALIGPGRKSPGRQPLPVDRLGDFELKSRIGAGGMGDVYLAREVPLDRMVALKVLRRELTDDPLRRLRFKREAQLTAALDHPNIVPIYGTGEDQGHVFLVMKHLPGTALDRVPERWEPRRIAKIGAQVARALHAAHEVGIVHRDIKPGNVQVHGDEAWVLDFGLARGRVDLTLTTEGQAPGTLAYMPPEQLSGEGYVIDPRGDVYSLGATLYHCVVGRPPFDEDTPEVLVRRALIHDPEPMPLGLGDRDLGTIVMRALEKAPQRRFPTALEFAEDLERFAAHEPIRSRPPGALTRMVKLARRHRVTVAALAAAVLVLLVLVPQLWRNAVESDAEVDRQFKVVEAALEAGLPAVARARLHEIEQNPSAAADPRIGELGRVTQATLSRDALLDRIQLDSVYRQSLLDAEFIEAMAEIPAAVRQQPLTVVALAFLARDQGDMGVARDLLRELGATGACPRVVAAFLALIEGRDAVVALDSVAPGTMAVADHVFAAVLLRIADAPSGVVDAEIDAAVRIDPQHDRARMMLGVKHWIGGKPGRASEVLTLLWSDERPRAEMHCMIARLAIIERDFDRAARHAELAVADLASTGRPPNRWVELARIGLAVARGQLEPAGQLLSAARAEFGDDEWFVAHEANIWLQRGEFDRVRELLSGVASDAQAAWNRRRARDTLLQIDIASWSSNPTMKRAQDLIVRAEQLGDEAFAVQDMVTTAGAFMSRFDVAYKLYIASFDQQPFDAALARQWENLFWDSLERALAAHDLHPRATFEAAQHMVNRLEARGESREHDLALGDLTRQVRRRAVELTRAGYFRQRPVGDLLVLAVFATYLSAAVGDPDEASEMGAIATVLIGASRQQGHEPDPEVTRLMSAARAMLELDAWPPPPVK